MIKTTPFFILLIILLCLASIVDAQTGIIKYSYDRNNRPITIITQVNDSINREYDNAGNLITQTIINHCENDIIAPVIACPANVTVNCQDNTSPQMLGTAAASDDCTQPPTVTSSDVITNGSCAGNYVITRTWTATDAAGNSSTCVQTITVHDITAPVITCPPVINAFTDNGTCSATINNLGLATATDNCGTPTFINNSGGNSFPVGTTTVIWTATDDCGNSATCNQTITVTDLQSPVFSGCPANIDTIIPAGNSQANITWTPPTTLDNCNGQITPVGSHTPGTSFGIGTTTVTYTATDLNGNVSTCSFTVSVSNSTIPIITCPANITVNCGSSTSPATTGTATATNNCGTPSITYSDVVSNGNCAGNYTISRTWVATGTCGNSASCIQTITVQDITAPVITCPANITTNTDEGLCYATVSLVPATATDNCGNVTITNNAPATFTVGVTNVIWMATDVCGNSSTCTQTVTVNDVEPPIARCNSNLSVQLNSSGNGTISVAQVNNGSADNCGIATLSVSPETFNCTNVGANTVVLSVTDVNGNTSTCNATVTVNDVTPPTAICQNITVQLDASGNTSILAVDIDNGSSDACGIASMSVSPNTFNCSDVGDNTVTLTVTDVNGNTSTCTATVTVENNVTPVVNCQNITVSLDANGNAVITASQVNNGSNAACGLSSLTISPNTFDCSDIGLNTVTLTATDVNGNVSTCTAQVTITDTVAPNAVCQNITAQLDANGTVTVTAGQIDNGSTDACGIASMTTTPSSFTCANLGSNTITLTVIDNYGNSSTCTSIVNVADTIAPTVLCHNISVNLDATGNASITAAQINNNSTDNCSIVSMSVSPNTFTCANVGANTVTLTVTDQSGNSSTCTATVTVNDVTPPVANCQNISVNLDVAGNVSITAAQINNNSTDSCGIASITVSPNTFTCANIGASTVTLTVTDVNGNVSTCNAIVTVEDNVNPVANCQNITVQLDATGNATITAAQVDNGSSDACGIASMTISTSSFTCANIGANNVTLTVTDVNGNSATCVAVVTVEDTIAPVEICQDISVQLNPGGSVTITAAQVDNGSADACGIASMSVSPSTFTCANVGANTVTLTVIDNNGNQSTCTATVTVLDNNAPIALCQNITVQLDANGNATITAAQVDNGSGDQCGPVTLSVNPSTFDCSNIGANTVTLTVTDNNGNSSTCTAIVTIEDNVAPVVICQNINVELDANGNVVITAAQVDNGTTDNCSTTSSGLTFSLSETSFDCSNIGANTVTFTATDAYGNSSTCTATVNVTDTVSPVVVCQNITVDLDANGNATITAAQVDNGSGDQCGPVTLSVNPSTFDCSNIGANTVTLTVTDQSGNSTTCTATVTIEDNTAPTVVCQNITVQLDANGNVVIVATDIDNGSSDNCSTSGSGLTFSASQTSFDCSNIGANTITLTVTDAYGNSSSCDATVTVADTVAPIAVCQNITVQLDASGNTTILAIDIDGGSTDNCSDINSGLTFSASQTAFDCSHEGANTVILTVTDAYGNVSTCTAVVTIENNVAPAVVCQDITVQLDATGNVVITAAQVDGGTNAACGIASLTVSPSSFDCSNVGANTVTLTATDNSGNVSTCTAVVTVQDTINPTIVCQNITVALDANGNAVITGIDLDNGTTDNCSTSGSGLTYTASQTNFDCSNVGANTVTLTVTDANGNSSSCNATVTVTDTVSPTVICQSITVQLDANGNAVITGIDVDGGSTDNCSTPGNGLTYAISDTDFDCSNVGANTVTLTVTDANGNSSSCSATVTIIDDVDPIALCQDITIQLDNNGQATIDASQVNNGSSDNCGIATMTVNPNTFTCAGIGSNPVTLTVTDVNGNVSTCQSTVTVQDNVDPVALCQDITINLDGTGNTSILSSQVDNGSNDACGIASITVSPNAFDCSNVGANTVTLVVTDMNGNVDSCTSVITVVDATAPTAICQNLTVALDSNGVASITAAQIDNGSNDACGIDTMTISVSSFDCSNVGDNTVTLTVTDVNGNSSTCTATVTIVDTISPTAICQNLTVQLDEAGHAIITSDDINNGSNDACGIASININTTEFDCSDLGNNTITFSVTDFYNNISTCTSNLVVEDNVPPDIICKDIHVTLDATGNTTITADQIDNGTTDACGIASMTVSPSHFNCSNIGINTVTLIVTDVNGNISSCTATVTIEDNITPTVICQNITVMLDATGNATIVPTNLDNGSMDNCSTIGSGLTFTANQTSFDCTNIGANTVSMTVTDAYQNSSVCDAVVTIVDNTPPNVICQNIIVSLDNNGFVTISATDLDGGSTDACGIASMSLSQTNFDCSNVGINSVFLTVTDNNGNSETCSAIVTIEDITPPIAVCQNITVQLDENGNVFFTAEDINAGSSDACEIVALSVDINSFNCLNIGPNIVSLTATDNTGNTDDCIAIVTVTDVINPVINCQNIIVQLDENGEAIITPENVDNGSFDECGIASMSVSKSTFNCEDLGQNIVIFTVIDSSGNSSMCETIITIEDSIAPNISIPMDTVLCAMNLGGILVNYNTPTAFDNCSGVTINQIEGLASGSIFPLGTTTNTFEVIDISGNNTLESFRVTINSQPVADFLITNACHGTPVLFQNMSTIPSGIITQYEWNFGDGGTSTDENPTHLYETDGEYFVTLTIVSDYGCTSSTFKQAIVYPAPTFFTEINDVTCNGYGDGIIVVIVDNGSGPFYYSLNGGNEQQNNTFSGLATGAYPITVRNSYNCFYSDTVTINEPFMLNLSEINSTGVNCEGESGGSITVSASGGVPPFQYFIDGGTTNQPSGTFLNETGGTHPVIVTDDNGCSFIETFDVPVLVGLPIASFTYDILNDLEVVFINTSTNSTNYHWSFGDGPQATVENPTHIYPQYGNYNAVLIAYNECGSDTFMLNLGELTTINEDTINFYTINVFPNPNNGSFTIMLESIYYIDELSIELWTVEGKLIDKTIAEVGNKIFSKNYTYQLAPGLYVLEISNKDIIHHEPLIIK